MRTITRTQTVYSHALDRFSSARSRCNVVGSSTRSLLLLTLSNTFGHIFHELFLVKIAKTPPSATDPIDPGWLNRSVVSSQRRASGDTSHRDRDRARELTSLSIIYIHSLLNGRFVTNGRTIENNQSQSINPISQTCFPSARRR